jgi:hypothetical protein
MRFYKTALNLLIIDFTWIEEIVSKDYYQQLNDWGILEESLKDKEKNRLRLYHYTKHMFNVLKDNDNNKNTVFYVIKDNPNTYLNIITKYLPFIVHYGSIDFKWIDSNNGESREIIESVKTTRFNFDYSKYSKQKANTFYEKYKIQPFI